MAPETCGQLSLVVETVGQNWPKYLDRKFSCRANIRSLGLGTSSTADVRSLTWWPLEDRRTCCTGVSQKHACSNGVRLRDSLPWPSE